MVTELFSSSQVAYSHDSPQWLFSLKAAALAFQVAQQPGKLGLGAQGSSYNLAQILENFWYMGMGGRNTRNREGFVVWRCGGGNGGPGWLHC